MLRFFTVFIVAFSIQINAQSDSNIKWLHPSPQGQDILWMKMWDANNWYMAGQAGMFMKTTDGGLTWKTNNRAGWPNTTYPNALTNWDASAGWFFDMNHGIIVGKNAAGILKTTDGGETFDTLRIIAGSSSGKNAYGIYFVNSSLGFICGNSQYKIYKTTDGGTTWSQLPNLDANNYHDVYATSALNITACADGGKIYKTTDGGTTWNVIQLGTGQPLYDLEFINSNTGFVCGGIGFFKTTTDGGSSWTSGVNTPTSSTNYKIKDLNNEIYVSGDNSNVFKSTDNGLSWSSLTIPDTGLFSGLNYCMDKSGSTLVVAGKYGNICKSTNSGAGWINLLQISTYWTTAASICVVNPNGKIIATGHWSDFPGSIIYSNDGGNTWRASPYVSGSQMLNDFQMFDNNNGYFVGDGGFVGKTTDGGLSITPLNVPFNNGKNILDLDFINQSTGWVAGGSPTTENVLIAKTTDGGVTWTDQSIATLGGRIKAIDMVDANTGYFAHSTIYKTTNGGTNWTTLTVPGASFFEDVKALDANHIYACGSDGTVGALYKSTNGGLTWSLVPTPSVGSATYLQEDWLDINNGIVTGTLGLVLQTSDGGANWTVMNTGGLNVTGCKMISHGLYFLAGWNGEVFKYDDGTSSSTFPLSVTVNHGWNMVSVPGINPDGMGVNTWWAYRDMSANVFKYAGGYQSVTTTTPGQGYWMKHSGARTYNTGDEWPAAGIQIVNHDPINANTGWNLIGGYELSVSTANITTVPPGLQTGPVYRYSGGYQVAPTLDPGYGYWIKVTGACQIIIPEVLAKGTDEQNYFKDDWGRIILTDASGASYTLYAVKGDVDLNQFELPPAPPQGMTDVRFSSGRIAEDIESSAKTIDLSGIKYPLRLQAENMDIKVTDVSGKQINANLKSGGNLMIKDASINKIMVSGDFVPDKYSLEQNYPNPFNPSTKIEFSLPENAGNVQLTIYNVLGQKVAELVNSALSAGKYKYQWDAGNVASGMYIYELRTDKFVSMKKMLLLK